MKDFELKVGDLVKLRNDLEDSKSYNGVYYRNFKRFNEFKTIEKILADGTIRINQDDENYYYYYSKEMIAEVKRPTKYETIYKREEPILDDIEKEYLSIVIRPFREKVKYIVKRNTLIEKEYIAINFKDNSGCLPDFKKNTMYKNMELNKYYTLEELGL